MLMETYYIPPRNLKVWAAQPMAIIGPVLTAAFMFLLFGAPLEGIVRLPGFPTDNYMAFLTAMILVMTMVFSW